MPASMLARIYARRLWTTHRAGTPTLGFGTAVRELQHRGEQPLRLGTVRVEDPPYHFQLFLDENLSAVVACLGVDRDASRRIRRGDRVRLECRIIARESGDFPGGIRAGITDVAGRTRPVVEKAPVLGIDLPPRRHCPQPPRSAAPSSA